MPYFPSRYFGVNSSSGNLTPEQLAQLVADAAYTRAKLEALPNVPLQITPSPIAPREHQVPVLFIPDRERIEIEIALLYEKPVSLDMVSLVQTPFVPVLDDTFDVHPGCYLYLSEYLVAQGGRGVYYATSSDCKMDQNNARFIVPSLPQGRTYWTLAELLKLYAQSLVTT